MPEPADPPAPYLNTRNQATAQISDVLRSMLSPHVRIGRLCFGMRALGLVAMAYLLGLHPITLGITAMVPSLVLDLLPWTITVCLAFTVLLWFQEVQRLHDLGYSGWYSIVRLVPVVNLIYWLALAAVGGQPFDNRFGAQPKHG